MSAAFQNNQLLREAFEEKSLLHSSDGENRGKDERARADREEQPAKALPDPAGRAEDPLICGDRGKPEIARRGAPAVFSIEGEDKPTSFAYRLIRCGVWLFSPKWRLSGAERLPEGPCVIVGNHSQMFGPIAMELYTPGRHWVWCAGEMMHREEVAAYAYQDFWSGKPRAVRWFYKLLSHLIVPLSVCVFNNAHTVAVYHDARVMSTFRESALKLKDGDRLVIFPECYEEYNNIVHVFQDRFIDLGRMYYKQTGKALPFVPLYVAPRLGVLYFGEPILYDPAASAEEERHRMAKALMDAVTDMAVALPEHTVVPYPNIPKKEYPKNIPLEVYSK